MFISLKKTLFLIIIKIKKSKKTMINVDKIDILR